MNRTTLLLLLFACRLGAVETKPLSLIKVIDGDTIEVSADLGGVEYPVRVRLLYVDTPEVHDNKHGEAMDEGKAAKEIASKCIFTENNKEGLYSLWAPGDKFERDQYGRILALVLKRFEDGGSYIVNLEIIKSGFSPYWRKYGDAPSPWPHVGLLKAQEDAEEKKAGVWATNPQWMKDKANERTAPKP